MKNAYLIIFLCLTLFSLPLAGFAAYNDVTLTTDAKITAGGATLDVTTSSAVLESIIVNASNFVVTLVSSGTGLSSIRVSSPNRYKLNHSVSPTSAYVVADECNTGASVVEFKALSGININVTVTPDTTLTCSGSGSGSGSTGGGGGGGSTPPPATPSAVPPVPPVVVPPVIPPPFVAQPSAVALAVSPVFNRTLQFGMVGEDVKRLQELLNSDPETLVAVSDAGSPGNETDFFGNLSRRAVGKFQLKYSVIASEEDNGYGIVGPRTRAKLAEVFGGQIGPAPIPEFQTAAVAILQAELRQLLEQLAILLQAQLRSLTGQ